MKLFIFAIIIACLLQSAFLGLNLCLALIVCRSLIVKDNANLYGAFLGGIFLGLLESVNLGFYPLFFLLIVELIYLIKKTPLASNFLTILPISFGAFLILSFLQSLIFGQSIDFTRLLIESLLSLPIYMLILFWEERFVVSPPLKLKV